MSFTADDGTPGGCAPGERKPDEPGRPYATWLQRVGALVLDTLVVGVPSFVLLTFAQWGDNSVSPYSTNTAGTGFWLAFWALVVGQFAYFAFLDGNSQTVGKRVLGIAVRSKESGGTIGTTRALVRWVVYALLWYAFFIPGLLNVLSPLWDSRRQAWHDRAVGSVVVRSADFTAGGSRGPL